MKRTFVLVVVFTVSALAIGRALAEKLANQSPKYDVANEVTIKGVVQEVREFQCPASGGVGAHLIVKSGDKTVLVHLALSKFLRDYGFEFAKGEDVVVLGAKAKVGEEEGILARQIDRGNQTITFRDKNGKPLW